MPIIDIHAPDFPQEPDFPPIVGNEGRKAVFSAFEFTPDPVPGNVEHIRILGTWVSDHIISVPIPQLRKALGPHAPETMQFHKLAAAQLQALWAGWEEADLLKLILTFDGSFVPRFQRGSTTALSNHAYGSAFDINCNYNPLNTKPLAAGAVGSVRELVPIANKHGFYWGGHFQSRPDGMHFEIGKLI